MNPNRITLLHLAQQKLAASLQLPLQEMVKIRILDLPVFTVEEGNIQVFGHSRETENIEQLPDNWTGLAVQSIGGTNSLWLLSMDEDTGEREINHLGSPESVEEALTIALDVLHRNMIFWQSKTLSKIA
jgi:hypothetical protein